MAIVTIYTSRLTERDKQSARGELFRGNLVRIYPTCINQGRRSTIKYQSEQFFQDLGAKPVEGVIPDDEGYPFFKV